MKGCKQHLYVYVAIWPEIIKKGLSPCVFVSPLPSSDSAICKWSPVQYPVYSLCETGSQRDGEIAELSSKYKIY